MALTARRAGVPKVLAKMTRPNYMDLVRDMRVGSIVSPKDIIANQITRYVRALANSEGSAVESLYKMLGGADGGAGVHRHGPRATAVLN